MATFLTRILCNRTTNTASFLVCANVGAYGLVAFRQLSAEDKPLPKVYFDMSANGERIGRIVFQLVPDDVHAEKFRAKCTGEKGLGFKGSRFDRVIPHVMYQGGDLTNHNETEERWRNFYRMKSFPGILSIANAESRGDASSLDKGVHLKSEKCALDNFSQFFRKIGSLWQSIFHLDWISI